jgi:sterol desaturase/sphingolipid hydroxylase (fatty acid hydroxylase superfamily)
MYVIYSFFIISSTIIASTATAFTIFKIYKYPFFHPTEDNNKTVNYVIQNTPLLLLESTLIGAYLLKNSISYEIHSIFHSASNFVLYSLGIDFYYYMYHRIAHSRYMYPFIHKKHHEKVDVYPVDTFYIDPIDSAFLILSMGAPVLFLDLNIYEYIFVLYLYITSGYFSHSTLLYNHHDLHHRLFFCNYSFFIPVMDVLLGTYRAKVSLS